MVDFVATLLILWEVPVNVLLMEMDQTLESKSQLHQLDHWQWR